jgi:Rrf2 family iron-sulfur cluster assembly transcriptional regulator
MIEIADAGGQLVTAACIVQRQNLPASFLDQLLGRLRRSHLVISVRGPRGGYRLGRAADSISLADIVNAVEGVQDSNGLSELAASHDALIELSGCAVEEAWRSAAAAMRNVMQSTHLLTLVERQRELAHHPVRS